MAGRAGLSQIRFGNDHPKMNLYKRALLIFSIFFCSVPTEAHVTVGPPPPPMTLEAAVKNSQNIVVAAYGAYRKGKVTFQNGPYCNFYITEFLKGCDTERQIVVQYDFTSDSWQDPKDWEFSDSLMPPMATKFILFLGNEGDKGYSTYRGSYGRFPFNKKNLKMVKKAIKKWKKQSEKDSRN